MNSKLKDQLITVLVAFGTAALTTFVAPILSAFFEDYYREQAVLVITPDGLRVDKPTAKVTLSGDNLVSLDNLTREPAPLEIEEFIDDHKVEYSKMIEAESRFENSEQTLGDTPANQARVIYHNLQNHPKQYQVSPAELKALISSVDNAPSPAYAEFLSRSPNFVADKVDALVSIVRKSTSVRDALNKISTVDPLQGAFLKDPSNQGDVTDLNRLEQVLPKLVDAEYNGVWEENSKVLANAKQLLDRSSRMQEDGARFLITVSATNVGQVPVSISRFGIVRGSDTTNGVTNALPVEISQVSSESAVNMVVGSVTTKVTLPPGSTREMVLQTPTLADIRDSQPTNASTNNSWLDFDRIRNSQGATAIVELFEVEAGVEIKSRSFQISSGSRVRKAVTDLIAQRSHDQFNVDVAKFLDADK